MAESSEILSTNIDELIEESQVLFDKKSWTQAFFISERAYNLTGDSNERVKKMLLESGYRAIWAAYGGEQFELMEYISRCVIALLEETCLSSDNPDELLKLAKSYNGLALALYQLGKRSVKYNILSSDNYIKFMALSTEAKGLKKVAQSRLKNDFGLIKNLMLDENYEDAIKHAEASLEFSGQYGLYIDEGLSHKLIGIICMELTDYDRGFSEFDKAEKLFRSKNTLESQRRLGELFLLICEYKYSLGEFETGKNYLDEAKVLFNKAKKTPYSFYTLLGGYHEYSGDQNAARDSYLSAVSLLNLMKWGVQFESNVDSFLKHNDREKVYLKAISQMFLTGDYDKGFEIFEGYRSKTFLESIRSGQNNQRGKIPLTLQKEREAIVNQLESLYESQSWHENDETRRLTKELYSCDEKIASVKGVYRDYSEYHAVPLKEITKSIPENLLVLEYFYDESKCYIFAVRKDMYDVHVVDTSVEELENLISDYLYQIRKEFQNPSWPVIEDHYMKQCHDILIAPVTKYLEEFDEVIIVPYKVLHSFPLHHLIFSVREDIKLSYLPNLQSILDFRSQPLPNDSAVLVGDPRTNLEGSRDEVLSVAELFDSPEIYLGEEASKQVLLERLSGHSMIHYSGHIHFNQRQPLYSFLECGDTELSTEKTGTKSPAKESDTVLYLKEIYQLNLSDTRFLSLSGCSSGAITRYRGEELVGLARGFFYSGVESILASLWDIEDQSSKDFLVCFFQSTFESGGDKKDGFRKAYQTMKKKYGHPFFYSGFTLYESI